MEHSLCKFSRALHAKASCHILAHINISHIYSGGVELTRRPVFFGVAGSWEPNWEGGLNDLWASPSSDT